jgi:addiction module RelE/StbE family toxin
MLDIKFTNSAEFDLEDIADFISKDTHSRALKYLDKMQNSIELLSNNPKLGILCKNKNVDLNCRIFIFEDYLIFYRVLQDSILIIRILHSSTNYKKILV